MLSIAMLIAAVVIAVLVYARLAGYAASNSYIRNREPQVRPWRLAYPDQSTEDVERILRTVCFEFLLKDRDIYRLRPTDRLQEIYRAAYPRPGGADALEFECLAEELEDSYGLTKDLTSTLWEATVSDVVDWCLQAGRLARTPTQHPNPDG